MANMNENTNKATRVASTIWGFSKSVALLTGMFCILALVMGWGKNGTDKSAYALSNTDTTVYGKIDKLDGKTLITDEGTYYSLIDDELCIPYASIYSIKVSDTQYLQFQQKMTPSIIRAVERELPNGTPNEKIIRCGYYSANETEAALNEVLGVTLDSNWKIDTVYTPSEASNQQEYSRNGRVSYDAYGTK